MRRSGLRSRRWLVTPWPVLARPPGRRRRTSAPRTLGSTSAWDARPHCGLPPGTGPHRRRTSTGRNTARTARSGSRALVSSRLGFHATIQAHQRPLLQPGCALPRWGAVPRDTPAPCHGSPAGQIRATPVSGGRRMCGLKPWVGSRRPWGCRRVAPQAPLPWASHPKGARRWLRRRLSDAVYRCLLADQRHRPAA
jgi:hypothetical protein